MVIFYPVFLFKCLFTFCEPFKWRILSRTGKIGSGKNTKYFFFLQGLEYTLRTCFESKNFLEPELSNQILSFSACQIVYKNCWLLFFQILDIWWSSLGIMDDFKLTSKKVIFHLGEIHKIIIFSFVKKIFF